MSERLKWAIQNTISVGRLIDILQKYPKEMLVITTWESTLHTLEEENLYESKEGHLYIDADDNFYKKEYAKEAGNE